MSCIFYVLHAQLSTEKIIFKEQYIKEIQLIKNQKNYQSNFEDEDIKKIVKENFF